MSWNNCWIGLAGGGFGVSAIVGASFYRNCLYNMGDPSQTLEVAIYGGRLGLTLQAEAAHAFCVMTGVPDGSRFERMDSSGIDWGAGYGVNFSSIINSSGDAIQALVRLAQTGSRTQRAVTQGALWAGGQTARNAVRGVMGDVTPNSAVQNFVLIPTPASLSIGAGIWYEWSEIVKLGAAFIWMNDPPDWCLDTRGGNVILKMRDVPEPNGSIITFVVTVNVWGPDDYIEWQQGPARNPNRIYAKVFDGEIYPLANTGPIRGQEGINLSQLVPSGRTEINMLTTGRNSEVTRNDTMEIGVDVMQGAVTRWSSDDYVEVRTDAQGRISQRLGTGDWRD